MYSSHPSFLYPGLAQVLSRLVYPSEESLGMRLSHPLLTIILSGKQQYPILHTYTYTYSYIHTSRLAKLALRSGRNLPELSYEIYKSQLHICAIFAAHFKERDLSLTSKLLCSGIFHNFTTGTVAFSAQ